MKFVLGNEVRSLLSELEIDNQNCFHIDKVDVFTGTDDYIVTDKYTFLSNEGKSDLEVSRRLFPKESPSSHRLRGEPAVRIHLKCETSPEWTYLLEISHHKGTVQIAVLKK